MAMWLPHTHRKHTHTHTQTHRLSHCLQLPVACFNNKQQKPFTVISVHTHKDTPLSINMRYKGTQVTDAALYAKICKKNKLCHCSCVVCTWHTVSIHSSCPNMTLNVNEFIWLISFQVEIWAITLLVLSSYKSAIKWPVEMKNITLFPIIKSSIFVIFRRNH